MMMTESIKTRKQYGSNGIVWSTRKCTRIVHIVALNCMDFNTFWAILIRNLKIVKLMQTHAHAHTNQRRRFF